MNTEIDFIEKQPDKFAPFIKLAIVFIIMLLFVVALLFFQKSNYQGQIETQSTKLDQLENALMKNQETVMDQQKQAKLTTDIQAITSTRIPSINAYENILGLLPSAKQLVAYENGAANQIIVGAQFKTLPEVATYVSSLLDQDYVTGTELTSVSFVESVYQATLTVSVDPNILVKEFGENE